MSHHDLVSEQCPRCGSQMVPGCLQAAVEIVHVGSLQSLEDSPLEALICLACGHVELQATCPENLVRQDISEEKLDWLLGEERS